MERGSLLLLIALQAIAGAVIYSRFSGLPIGANLHVRLQAWASQTLPSQGSNCGLLKWDSYILVSERVVTAAGIRPAAVHVSGGKIQKITSPVGIQGLQVLNFLDAVIAPGVIDVHVHLNEPGRETWEGIPTGTLAAAAGGTTSVIDMPLNSFPVTTSVEQLQIKRALAKVKAHVDIGYWAGLIPENAHNHTTLQALVDHGVCGFKAFMSPSGINDFPHVERADLAAALPLIKAAGRTLFVHAERVDAGPGEMQGDPRAHSTWSESRPPAMEQAAVTMLIELLDEDTTPASPGFVLHIAHLADAGCLPLIKAAQARHPITVETSPHFLHFSQEDIRDGQTQFKCAPPIRDAANKAALREALAGGALDMVSSDHSPAPPDMKHLDTGLFTKAWGGIAGVQYVLSATWTVLSDMGGSLTHLVSLLSEAPAKLAGLGHRKGHLLPGYDADILVWNPEALADTSRAANQHHHKISLYENIPLKGKVLASIVRGQVVALFGALSTEACGAPLQRQ